MSLEEIGLAAGTVGHDDLAMRAEYPRANLYPYKLRPDTYYCDGWKLPQTQMLFALSEGIKSNTASAIGRGMLEEWMQRPPATSYESWIESKGGEAWINGIFDKGCTLIPTFEAHNGFNVVGRDYALEDVWPGRAVTGLHTVQESRADKAPAGTILEVLAPGYMTATEIVPASVIISDGSKYISPNITDPAPVVPNLNLPHQRLVADWEAAWIPTHPGHFECPALWGWDLETGRFMQFTGPLWDPLHYYYSSTPRIIEAFKKPLAPNRWLASIPADMQERFHPVVPMPGFDVLSSSTPEGQVPQTSIIHMPTKQPSCGIGYHPMPPDFEFELDPFWFPDVHPLNRPIGPCPEHLSDRICGVVQSTISPEHYLAAVGEDVEHPWLADPAMLTMPLSAPLENYPYLVRYILREIEPEIFDQISFMPFLAEHSPVRLSRSVQDICAGLDEPQTLEEIIPGLHQDVWSAREEALERLRMRYLTYVENPTLYRVSWWYSATVSEMMLMFAEWLQQNSATPNKAAPVATMPVVDADA